MQIENLIEVAINFRLAELKAREQGIINISGIGTEREAFQFFGEKDFAKIIKDKEYTIKRFDKGYEYTSTISGLKFFCIADNLLFDGDEQRIIGGSYV